MKSDEFNLFISLDCQPTLKYTHKMNDILENILTTFALKENISKPSFIILYNGQAILEEDIKKSISEIMNETDKREKSMTIVLYTPNQWGIVINDSNNININLIIDSKDVLTLQGKKSEILNQYLKAILQN